MKKPNTKTFLFDFDGTLVDSMPTFISVMLRILDEHGIKYGDDIVKTITPLGYHGTAEYYRELGISTPVEDIVEQMNKYAFEEYAHKILAKDGVIETLMELKRQGANLNVLTASPHSALDPCLKRLGIFDIFTNVWSCDDFKTTKANPQIYAMAAQKIAVPIESIIFVDDNINAVKTAKLAGMQSFGIYDDSSAEYIDEMRTVSDRYIKNFTELLDT